MGVGIALADTQEEKDYGQLYANGIALDVNVPRALLASAPWFPWLAIGDSHLLCLSLVPRTAGAGGTYRVLVSRKRDKS